MTLPDNWLRRQRAAAKRGTVDPLRYDEVPGPLRVQILNVLRDGIGTFVTPDPWSYAEPSASTRTWAAIEKAIAHELGMFRLGSDDDSWRNFAEFFLATQDIDHLLFCVEYALRVIDGAVRGWHQGMIRESGIRKTPDAAISEINARLLENSVGYQWLSGHIVRVDNQVLHSELVVPALQLLADPFFAGPNQEFLEAHEHFRHGRFREAIVDATRAFESAMKVICDKRGWAYPVTATASTLIGVIFDQGLIPAYLTTQFSSLRSLLESGAPTVQNKTSAHGGGSTPAPAPSHLASYAINLAAANIVLLAASDQASP